MWGLDGGLLFIQSSLSSNSPPFSLSEKVTLDVKKVITCFRIEVIYLMRDKSYYKLDTYISCLFDHE